MSADEYRSDLVRSHEAAVERAVAGMSETLSDDFRLTDLAAAGLFSPYHFHRTFRRVTATTPARFLATLRMQRAKLLLAETSLTVAAVGGLVGYESLGTFTTQFGRLVGVSPGRFRRLVDACGTTRLDEVEPVASSGPPNHELATTRAEPDAFAIARTTIVGVFRETVPSGIPSAFALVGDGGGGIDVPSGADRSSTLAMSVPQYVPLVRLAIGDADGVLVGRAIVDRHARHGTTEMGLRVPRVIDPPLVSAAAALQLVGCR